MGLRLRCRTESLERRLCLAVEPAVAATYLDADTDLMAQSAAVASASDGGSVVAYSDRDSATGKGNDVWIRRYFASGLVEAAAVRINTTLAGAQMNVDVAMATFDNYAAIWQSENQDGSGWGIYARLHTISGWSNEILVNATTTGAQVSPKIAMDGGGFIATWVGRDDNGGNGVIYGRRFSAAGTAASNEVALSSGANFAVTAPDVAANAGAAFTWVSADINNAGQTDVKFAEYDSTLQNPQGTTQTVNTVTTGDQAEPAIAAVNGTSDYVVAFSDTSGGGNEASILYRRMNSGVGPTTYPVQVANQDSDGNRNRPQIAALNGTSVIGWTQQPVGATYSSAVTRVFDSNLSPISNELAVTDGTNATTLSGLAVTGNGTYREVSTLGEFTGYGIGSTATFANVLEFDGTSGPDLIVLSDVDAQTIRASVNGSINDYTRLGYDHVRVELGGGNDTLVSSTLDLSWVTVGGGAGNDTIATGDAADSIGGGDGNDSIDAGGGADYVIGGSGNDIIYGRAGDDTLTGGAGKDSIYGGTGNDRIAGSGSPDLLQGEEDDDRIYGEDGDDRCDGGGGRDRCYGGDGNDLLIGGSSNDRLFGEAGNDTLSGGPGNDYLDGGDGTDLISKREPGDTLIGIP